MKRVAALTLIVFGVLLKNQGLYGQTALAKLNQYFSIQDKKEPLNGVVVIQRKGKTIFEKAFGYASVENSVKNALFTRFPIASITKPFIATSILLLEQKRLLSVQDKIRKYLPETPESWQDISIEHLLSHTSGISDYLAQARYDTLKHLETTNDRMLQQITALPLHFKAGASYDYCNSNYVLLACIIERVTGAPVDSFVQKEICQPLGLKSTFFPNSNIPVKGLANGYLWQEKLFKADHINFSNLSGSGGLISTAGDLSLFLNAMMQSKILPKAVVDKMVTPIQEDYGYGWMNRSHNNSRLIGHTGRIDGYSSQMWYEPKQGISVVYLSNVYNGNFSVIANVFDILLNAPSSPKYKVYEEIRPVVPYAIAANALDDYAGSYRFRNQTLKITRIDNKLYIIAGSENEKAEMVPYSQSKFWVGGPANITVLFVRDKLNQKITKAEIVLNGSSTMAEKE